MSRRYAAGAACWLALVGFDLSRPAVAQILGDRTEATNCASAVGGSVNNSTVSVVCGIPHEQAAEFLRLAVSGRPGDYTELLRRLDALIPASSRLRAEALARFFDRLGEANIPPEQLTAKLVEIAGRYQELLGRLETTSSPDPEVQRLKERAREALQGGDFAATERLLNEAKARDRSASEQMQAARERLQAALEARKLSAAEAAGENGALMMTQLRYAAAARYFAEAAAHGLGRSRLAGWRLSDGSGHGTPRAGAR